MSIIEESKQLINLLGGEKNIHLLTHCATRLRFELNDNEKANTTAIENLPFVLSTMNPMMGSVIPSNTRVKVRIRPMTTATRPRTFWVK